VNTHSVYVLVDPTTNEIRYVGCTSTSLKARLSVHVSVARSNQYYGKPLNERQEWIMRLQSLGLRPEIRPVGSGTMVTAWRKEANKIIDLKAKGANLFNVVAPGRGTGPRNKQAKQTAPRRIQVARKKTIGGLQWTTAMVAALDAIGLDSSASVNAGTRRTLEDRGMVRSEHTPAGFRSHVTDRGRAMAQTLAPLKEEAGQ
jgi:hypothetical protein